jgi:hypothetical protein
MARYATTIASPWPADEAFAFMADLRNFERWDPGVSSSKLVSGEEPGLGAAYDVKASGISLRYETLEFAPPSRTVVEARTSLLRSYDVIEVTPTDGGCQVAYDATLTLGGPLGLVDPLLRLAFDRIGGRAAEGLREALDGEKLT